MVPAVFKPQKIIPEHEEVVQEEKHHQQQQGEGEGSVEASNSLPASGNASAEWKNRRRVSFDDASMHMQERATTPALASVLERDPVILEILSFWSYYRSCGYDAEAMAAWVAQNYDEKYAPKGSGTAAAAGEEGVDYEGMLKNKEIASQVEQHISRASVSGGGGGAATTSTTTAHLEEKEGEKEVSSPLLPEPAGAYAARAQEKDTMAPYQPPNVCGTKDGGAEAGGEGGVSDEVYLSNEVSLMYEDGSTAILSDTTLIAGPPGGGEMAVAPAAADLQGEGSVNMNVHEDAGIALPHTQGMHTSESWAGFEEATSPMMTATNNNDIGEEQQQLDPTLGHVLGSLLPTFPHHQQQQQHVESAGQLMSTVGGALKGIFNDLATAGTGDIGNEYSTSSSPGGKISTALPWEKEATAALDAACATTLQEQQHQQQRRQLYDSRVNGYTPTTTSTPGASPISATRRQNDHDHEVENEEPGALFSPGKLAADLGVPRDAVTISALFAVDAASVGTLSSRASSEAGDMGGGAVVDVVEVVGKEWESVVKVEQGEETTTGGVMEEEVAPALPFDNEIVEGKELAVPIAIPATATATATGKTTTTTTIETQTEEEEEKNEQDYEETIADLQARLHAALARATAATMELEEAKEEGAKQAASLAEALEARDAAHRGLLNEKETAWGKEQTARDAKVHEVEERLGAVQQEYRELKRQLEEEKRAAAAAVSAAVSAAAAEREEKEKEEESAMKGSMAALQAELDELREALQCREQECDDLREALELKDDAIVALQASAAEAKKEQETLRQELEEAKRAVVAAEEDAGGRVAAALEDVREKMSQAVEAVVADKNGEMARIEAALREEMALQSAQLDRYEAELHATAEEKETELVTIEARAVAAEQEAGDARLRVEALETQLAAKDAEVESALSRAKEWEKKFVLAKKKIAVQQQQHDVVVAEVAALQQQLAALSSTTNNTSVEKEEELRELTEALDAAAVQQQALSQEAALLHDRLEEVSASKAAEVQALAADNAQLVQMLGERDAEIERLAGEVAAIKGGAAATADLQAALEAAKDEIQQWAAVAEDADARCTATEEALAAEHAAREEAAAAAAFMHQELASLQSALSSSETQLAQVVAMQEVANAKEEQLAALRVELETAQAALKAIDRGGFEDALEEVEHMRAQLAAASQVAAAKEEELRKYKLQLVKAKKVRAMDCEKIAALEAQVQVVSGTDSSAAQQQQQLLQQKMEELQKRVEELEGCVNEGEGNLEDALSALGTEEAKVARLAELLMEKGAMDEGQVEEELTAVEELMLLADEEEDEEESLI